MTEHNLGAVTRAYGIDSLFGSGPINVEMFNPRMQEKYRLMVQSNPPPNDYVPPSGNSRVPSPTPERDTSPLISPANHSPIASSPANIFTTLFPTENLQEHPLEKIKQRKLGEDDITPSLMLEISSAMERNNDHPSSRGFLSVDFNIDMKHVHPIFDNPHYSIPEDVRHHIMNEMAKKEFHVVDRAGNRILPWTGNEN